MSAQPQTGNEAGPIEVVARAILRNGPRVLLARMVGQEFWFLPGSVVPNGSAATAFLQREVRSELGVEATVGDLVGVAENRYTYDGITRHEMNLVFDVRISGNADHSIRPELELRWFDTDTLDDIDIRPTSLANMVRYGPGSVRLRLLSNGDLA